MNPIAPFFHNAPSGIFINSKALRKPLTPAEKVLWQLLRNRKVKGFKFRRQHPIAHYIADFYCHEALLVIELDGAIHERKDVKIKDKLKQDYLESTGITVLRFKNEELFEDINPVLQKIQAYLQRK